VMEIVHVDDFAPDELGTQRAPLPAALGTPSAQVA
jgi:hypothetical protein